MGHEKDKEIMASEYSEVSYSPWLLDSSLGAIASSYKLQQIEELFSKIRCMLTIALGSISKSHMFHFSTVLPKVSVW